VTVVETAQVVGESERQMKRLWARYRREGTNAVAHCGRGKVPVNAVETGLARRVAERA